MTTRNQRKAAAGEVNRVRELLFAIEPDLHLLKGVVALLRSLGEADDLIEPAAVAAVAHLAEEVADKVSETWRACLK